MVYKKHHPTTQIDSAHTSLDKKCPSLKAILAKYKKNRILTTTVHTQGNMENIRKEQINCNQINLKRSRGATDNFTQIITQENTDMVMIQEPYLYQKQHQRNHKWLPNINPRKRKKQSGNLNI